MRTIFNHDGVVYHSWGTSLLIQRKFEFFDARPVEEENRDFLEEDVKFQYTNKEKTALAVFTLITIFSIIEIILAAVVEKKKKKKPVVSLLSKKKKKKKKNQ